jgi:hypothetical protein
MKNPPIVQVSWFAISLRPLVSLLAVLGTSDRLAVARRARILRQAVTKCLRSADPAPIGNVRSADLEAENLILRS